jgi:hypothetical protein
MHAVREKIVPLFESFTPILLMVSFMLGLSLNVRAHSLSSGPVFSSNKVLAHGRLATLGGYAAPDIVLTLEVAGFSLCGDSGAGCVFAGAVQKGSRIEINLDGVSRARKLRFLPVRRRTVRT